MAQAEARGAGADAEDAGGGRLQGGRRRRRAAAAPAAAERRQLQRGRLLRPGGGMSAGRAAVHFFLVTEEAVADADDEERTYQFARAANFLGVNHVIIPVFIDRVRLHQQLHFLTGECVARVNGPLERKRALCFRYAQHG